MWVLVQLCSSHSHSAGNSTSALHMAYLQQCIPTFQRERKARQNANAANPCGNLVESTEVRWIPAQNFLSGGRGQLQQLIGFHISHEVAPPYLGGRGEGVGGGVWGGCMGGGRGGEEGRGGMGWAVGEGGVGSYTQKAVHTQGGAYTRRCTHKAVCGHRRSHVI